MRSFTGKKKKEPAAEEDKRKRHGQQIVPAFRAEPEQHQAAKPIDNAMEDLEEFNKQMVAGPMQGTSANERWRPGMLATWAPLPRHVCSCIGTRPRISSPHRTPTMANPWLRGAHEPPTSR